MMHPSVLREMYGGRRGARRASDQPPAEIRIPKRHLIAVLLMFLILGSWALDALHVHVIPRQMHDSVASMIDSQRHLFPAFGTLPAVDCAVAYNPVDDSPISFGSVILLGVICIGGLAKLGFSTPKQT